MKSYTENVAYQDLTAAIEKAHETLESIKLETKTAEYAVKTSKKDGKSKFEISILQLALRQQKLKEESQNITQKVAELEREHWVSSFKKAFKKAEKEEKEEKTVEEEAKKVARKSSKGHLKIMVNGENVDIETESKKAKALRAKNIRAVATESSEAAPTESKKVKTPTDKKVKAAVTGNQESTASETTHVTE